ncbi:MAG TPA: hypothetical protein PKC22_16765, partial [Rhodocyclaceae bacterium]|nr:hypothetical protein [Rhodocyclaceae bacterium]
MFKFGQKSGAPAAQWRRHWTADGLLISQAGAGQALSHPLLPGYLAQLQDDGYAVPADADLTIGWDALYEAMQGRGYADLPQVFELPPWTTTRPVLCSANSLTDEDFAIAIAGWQRDGGLLIDCDTVGPVLSHDDTVELMLYGPIGDYFW